MKRFPIARTGEMIQVIKDGGDVERHGGTQRTVNNPKLTVPTNLVRAIGLMLRPNRDLAIF